MDELKEIKKMYRGEIHQSEDGSLHFFLEQGDEIWVHAEPDIESGAHPSTPVKLVMTWLVD